MAEEEADTCSLCGLPKVVCRENKDGRARFDVEESTCWASYRVGLRYKKQADEKVDPVMQRATQVFPRFRPGYEPDVNAGLGLSADSGEGGDQDGQRHS